MQLELQTSNKQLLGLVFALVIVAGIGYVYSQAPNPGHTWSQLGNMPAGFADNIDNDALGGITCSNGQFLEYSGGSWSCTTPSSFTDTYCTSDGTTITCPDTTSLTDYCSGGTCIGGLSVPGNIIANSPIANNHVATKAYVDAQGGGGGACYWEHGGSCASDFTQIRAYTRYLCSNSLYLRSPSLHTIILPPGISSCPGEFYRFTLGGARLCCR